jgi:hypothetical protein
VNACGDSGTVAAPPAPTPTPVVLTPPKLVSPEDGAFVRQNDPATGCSYNPDVGYGYQTTFTWSPVPGAFAYRLDLLGPHAVSPAVNRVTSATSYLNLQCHNYVIDPNLAGWQWRVRTVAQDGREGNWSEARTLHFTPCRITPRQPCLAR